MVTASLHLPEEEVGIITSDGIEHLWESNSLSRIGDIDLATITFLSPKKYQIASFGDSTKIRTGNTIYIAGFPLPSKSFPINLMRFLQGQIIAKASVDIPYGYQLLYSNQTLSGMSGGPILDSNGDLIGIHGRAEKHDQITNQLGKIIATGTNQTKLDILKNKFENILKSLKVN